MTEPDMSQKAQVAESAPLEIGSEPNQAGPKAVSEEKSVKNGQVEATATAAADVVDSGNPGDEETADATEMEPVVKAEDAQTSQRATDDEKPRDDETANATEGLEVQAEDVQSMNQVANTGNGKEVTVPVSVEVATVAVDAADVAEDEKTVEAADVAEDEKAAEAADVAEDEKAAEAADVAADEKAVEVDATMGNSDLVGEVNDKIAQPVKVKMVDADGAKPDVRAAMAVNESGDKADVKEELTETTAKNNEEEESRDKAEIKEDLAETAAENADEVGGADVIKDDEEIENDEEKQKEGSATGTEELDGSGDMLTPKKKEKKVRSVGGKKGDVSKAEDAGELGNPSPYSLDRPVRARKSVERLVEVIEKEPDKNFIVGKGRGTPLKDIPSVAHKLARKKPTDADIKLIHSTLFGRKGKTANFKAHILQYSGFVWHESDEKQRAKAKERLDKYVKDTLLELCDTFTIPVSKGSVRKEDLVEMLLDFIAEPHAARDDALRVEEMGSPPHKRKRSSKAIPSRSAEGSSSAKRSRKVVDDAPRAKGKPWGSEDDEEEGEDEGEREDKEDDEDEEHDDVEDYKVEKEKRDVAEKMKRKSTARVAEAAPRVFSAKRKSNIETDEKKSPRVLGKRASRSKGKAEKEWPGKDDLRRTIVEILGKVDFNAVTFSDIVEKLGAHYKMDMAMRKQEVKLMIQEELSKLAEEAEDGNDENGSGEGPAESKKASAVPHPASKRRKVEA